MDQQTTLRIVVIGAAGSGKSSLINTILGQNSALVGDCMDGVTKDITAYEAILNENNMKLILYDIPGFGDIDVGVEELVILWNKVLENKKIDLIFYCHQISYVRMDQITRSSLKLMKQSLKNPMIEKSFVIVITQSDLKPEEEIPLFKIGFVKKELIPKLKELVDANEINQVIYTSKKKRLETIQQISQICTNYLNDKKILRVGLLGDAQSGITKFINIFSETPLENKQQNLLQSVLTEQKYKGFQIEFEVIQFIKDLPQENFNNEWFQFLGSKKLHLLCIFIKQNDEIMDILQKDQLQKYQSILEQKQLNESYIIVINPCNLQDNIQNKQKKIQQILGKSKIYLQQNQQFVLSVQDQEKINIKHRFEQSIESYKLARNQFENTIIIKITEKQLEQVQQEVQKKTGSKCISLNSKILTNSGYIDISKLQIGQIILITQNNLIKTDKIIGFIHKSSNQLSQFVKLIFQSRTYVTLTPNHLLKLYQSSFIQAQFVKKGDLIERWNGKEIQPDQVLEIQNIYEYGYTCPLSQSGELIINDYVVSCYSNCSQQVGNIFTWPLRNISLIRYLFNNNEASDEIHPYFKLLSSINRYLHIACLND